MDESGAQMRSLEVIFQTATFAPLFKPNPKHCKNQFAHFTPYISYKDIINKKYFIRGCPIGPGNFPDTGQRDIIAEYASIEELVNDGWQLDA